MLQKQNREIKEIIRNILKQGNQGNHKEIMEKNRNSGKILVKFVSNKYSRNSEHYQRKNNNYSKLPINLF